MIITTLLWGCIPRNGLVYPLWWWQWGCNLTAKMQRFLALATWWLHVGFFRRPHAILLYTFYILPSGHCGVGVCGCLVRVWLRLKGGKLYLRHCFPSPPYCAEWERINNVTCQEQSVSSSPIFEMSCRYYCPCSAHDSSGSWPFLPV